VEDLDRAVLQDAFEGGELPDREDVHHEGLVGCRELQQARLPFPGVKGGRLDVRAYGLGLREALRYAGELARVRDEAVGGGAFLHRAILQDNALTLASLPVR
jgi:hypothetical protein